MGRLSERDPARLLQQRAGAAGQLHPQRLRHAQHTAGRARHRVGRAGCSGVIASRRQIHAASLPNLQRRPSRSKNLALRAAKRRLWTSRIVQTARFQRVSAPPQITLMQNAWSQHCWLSAIRAAAATARPQLEFGGKSGRKTGSEAALRVLSPRNEAPLRTGSLKAQHGDAGRPLGKGCAASDVGRQRNGARATTDVNGAHRN